MSKQIINSHKLIHLVSKDFLVRVEGCSRYMHKICKGFIILLPNTLYLEKQATLQFGHYWRTQFGNTGKIRKKIKMFFHIHIVIK